MARYDILSSIAEHTFFDTKPSLVVRIGHQVTLTERVEPLVRRAIAGAPAKEDVTWSPACAWWIAHRPDEVRELYSKLSAVWLEERSWYERRGDDYASWSIDQIEEVLRVFRHASGRGEWILSSGEIFEHDPRHGARGPGSPPYPPRAPCPDTRPAPRLPVGPVLGGIALGVLALCVLRGRRARA